jgi:hypothetical protein
MSHCNLLSIAVAIDNNHERRCVANYPNVATRGGWGGG